MWRLILSLIIFITLTIKGYSQYHNEAALTKLRNERILLNEIKEKKIKAFKNKSRSLTSDTGNGFEIFDITPAGVPIYRAPLNAGASITTGANTLQNQLNGLNLQGENISVGVWDDGLVKDHIELGSRIISKQGYREQTHATHVVGTILATGINASAKGMAPKALATTWDFYNDDAEMAALAKTDQSSLLFSNHSYGIITGWFYNGSWIWSGDATLSNEEDYRFGYYGEIAQVLDQITYLAPYYTIVWAAGNDRADVGDGTHPRDGNGGTGYDCIIPESVAKNIITIGAVNKVPSYSNASSVAMSNFSSWGPTDDGRIKPDLVAAGVGLYSLSASGTNEYRTLTGTSMATPNATGSLVLVQELYSKLHGGNFMKASTLKGLAIHSAKEAGSFPGPDYSYGWGLLDVDAAAKILLQEDDKCAFVKELSLDKINKTYALDIYSQANKKITVTICWTDPAGNPVAASLDPTDRMLVNDLDVRIQDEAGNLISPWILDPANPTFKATTGDNIRDNVEKIEFNTPAAKKYTITVTHKGELVNSKQDFSLIVTCKSSLPSYTTYYWIGNAGNWNDGTHWSFTTGGGASNRIPSDNDNVMFDENSFDINTTGIINFTSDASCRKLTWLTDKSSGLALNNHTLNITNDFSLAGKNLKILTKGILQFEGISNNTINLHSADLRNASLLFVGGAWIVSGKLLADKAELINGELTMKNLSCNLLELNAFANTTLNITGTRIDSLMQSSIHETVNLSSDSSVIDIASNTLFNWTNIDHKGKIIVGSKGKLQIKGSNSINELQAEAGAVIVLDDAATLNFSNIKLNAKQSNLISIESAGKAAISLNDHQRLCFDFLKVKNVNARGNAVLNAGLNSAIVNADQWLQEDCSNIIFSDFDFNYNCANGLTAFTDRSLGHIVLWSWNFGDPDSNDNTATTQNASHSYTKEGNYLVTLTVSDSNVVNTFSKDIIITTNDLPVNTIVVNGNILMSLQQATNYQWYNNGEAIEGAVSRTFDFEGLQGNYTVVTMPESRCNSVSQPFVLTGVDDDTQSTQQVSESIQMFPNPADDFIQLYLSGKNASEIILYNILGEIVLSQNFSGSELKIDVSNFKEGVYNLEVKSSQILRRKFIITR